MCETALEGVIRERDEAREAVAEAARHRAALWTRIDDEVRRQRAAQAMLAEVAHSGVEHDDPRLDYVTVQIDRRAWDAIQQAVFHD